MALRDQPYLPLYVQDFLTDERLNECSAESTGVYIRLMCILHKSQTYGAISLKQKDKRTGKQISDFALKLVKQMPYDVPTIERSLAELLEEDVLSLDSDTLSQKRMVRDGKASDVKASAGKKGAEKKRARASAKAFACDLAKAEAQANAENENEYETEVEIETEYGTSGGAGGDCASPVIVLPLNTGDGYCVSKEQCQEWAGLYPAVDVIQQLRNMKGWLDANPTRKKTRKGIKRFINGWLSREQDRGSGRQQGCNHAGRAMGDLQTLHDLFSEED